MLTALSRWKTVLIGLSSVLFVALLASRHLVGPHSSGRPPAGPVPATEASDHVGNRAEVCGRVANVIQITNIDGRPTFINLGDAHPDQAFTALLWRSDRQKWSSPPETLYDGRSICVTGTVDLHEGTPQIVVSDPNQIQVR